MASSTSRPERDDQRAKRDAVQVDPHQRHDEEGGGQHQRDGQGDDQAGPPAERQQRNHEHDADRLAQRLQELMDGLADDLRLVRDAAELGAERQILLDALEAALHGGTDLGHVAAGRHGGAEQHGLMALIARLGAGRIFQRVLDLGDIAEPERLLPDAQPQLADVLDRF